MSIWYDGTNLNMYRGDSGTLIFAGLPLCPGYRVYFSVKSIKTGEIIFERTGDPENYYIDNEGEIIKKLPGETDEEFYNRCEEMVESGDAMKRAHCKIYITPDDSEKLYVAKGNDKSEYYYGLKLCYSGTGIENTVIPFTKIDEETGEVIFKDPPKLIVKPIYSEGFMPCEKMSNIEEYGENPKDYGIQPLLGTNIENLVIDDKTNIIDISKSLSDKIEDTKSRVETLEPIVDENTNDIEFLEDKVDTNISNISTLSSIVSDMSSMVDTHEIKINNLTTTVGNHRTGLVKDVDVIKEKQATYGDIVTHNASDFQAKLTPGLGIEITNNKISVNLKVEDLSNVVIEDLQDGDVLTYQASLGKWVNKPLH